MITVGCILTLLGSCHIRSFLRYVPLTTPVDMYLIENSKRYLNTRFVSRRKMRFLVYHKECVERQGMFKKKNWEIIQYDQALSWTLVLLGSLIMFYPPSVPVSLLSLWSRDTLVFSHNNMQLFPEHQVIHRILLQSVLACDSGLVPQRLHLVLLNEYIYY